MKLQQIWTLSDSQIFASYKMLRKFGSAEEFWQAQASFEAIKS